MDVIWACDFFTEEVWSYKGLVTVYVLFFIHLGTRRVHIAGVMPYPKATWMQQQARNLLMMAEDAESNCNYLIHDQDTAFLPFDYDIKSGGINVVKTPKRSPWCNGYAEQFVREARETLNNLVLVGENQLYATAKKIEQHHNFRRPHQGLGNLVPMNFDDPDEAATPKQVRCDSELGGLLNHYYVDQAA
jgi:putative transposase